MAPRRLLHLFEFPTFCESDLGTSTHMSLASFGKEFRLLKTF